MDKSDAFWMAFHTSNALGFTPAQRAGNQIAAAALLEEAESENVQEEIEIPEDLKAQFQALDDAIRSLLSIGNSD